MKCGNFSWSGFEECLIELQKWLKGIEEILANEPQLKSTLDEKRAQLHKYKQLLNDTTQRGPDFMKLRDLYDSLPQKDDHIKEALDSVLAKYDEIHKKTQVSA